MDKESILAKAPPIVDIPTLSRRAGYASLRNQGNSISISGRDGRMHLNKMYLADNLSAAMSKDLLDTVFHEGLHFTEPWIMQGPDNNYDHAFIVPKAAQLTAKNLGKYNTLRKKLCGCEGK